MTDNPYASPEPVRDTPVLKKRPGSTFLKLLLGFTIIAVLVALLLPATRRSGRTARRTQCKNNLKQIALALHNYESIYDALPPAYTVDAAGKPLHSWRTLILPFVEQLDLYKTIDLSKPWDDPANAEVLKTVPHIFRCPSGRCRPASRATLALLAQTPAFIPSHPERSQR